MSQLSRVTEPIPGYLLKERIGVGGYGEVWSAQAPGDLSKAIKFVYGHFDDERAAREMKALNRIKEVRHPFLLSLERFEIIDGQLIIVTELADMSLKDRFEQAKKEGLEHIPREELLGYMRDAADALDYMSENFSLQHLDVKPENLLLIGGRVKVADFGLVKELHDVTASMMGGLTPVYAPPEVFDGRPSQRSDQYSLAIVYQEMLTAVLPFPGRTAAQLASQHLHARPRLAPLPSTDQPIVARALSKDPAQRFASCRALVDALSGADQKVRGQPSSDARPKARPESTSDTTSIRSRAVSTDHDWQRSKDAARESAPNTKTMVIGDDSGHTVPSERLTGPPMPPPAPIEAAVELPPVELATGQSGLRPTLFLGIGGTATRTLKQLRRQLHDRLGPAVSMPAVQMLLLDTDSRNLYQATQGDPETALADFETVALPLRNAHDYTSDAGDSLNWLSRRWLYNIPRSQQTEGRRPLGRLALVDHADQVLERLRKTLAAITSPEAIAATSEATGLPFGSKVPRVFVVSSISGGTGGGMVLDVAYAVRTILADAGLSDDGVCGILTHSTDRNPTTNDLAIANAYACLSELHHFSGPGSYPGDAACGLPSFTAAEGTFPHTYLVHLGDNLTDDQFELANDALASYLYLNAITGAADAFDQCRKLAPAYEDGVALHSFGLIRVGSLHTSLPALATDLLCKDVIDRWRGASHPAGKPAVPFSLVDRAAQRSSASTPASPSHGEQRAENHAVALELDFDKLDGQIRSLVEKQLGGGPDVVFTKLRAGLTDDRQAAAPHFVRQMLEAISAIFGPSSTRESAAPPTPLQAALETSLKQFAADKGSAARDWILSLIETPDGRVAAASRARQWYDTHLRSIESQSTERASQTRQELAALEQALLAVDGMPPPRTSRFSWRRAENTQPEIDDAVVRAIGLRFDDAVCHAISSAVRMILTQVTAAGDQIKDLQRELGQLAAEFAGESPWTDADGKAPAAHVGEQVKLVIAESLRGRMRQMADVVDARFQTQFLVPQGGMRNVFQKADTLRSTVRTALRRNARSEIVKALKEIPIDETVLGSAEAPESRAQRLRACLDGAKPRLDRCGGSQRLLAILPDTATGTALAAAFSQVLDPPATVVRDADADLVFCYEAQELLVPHVAARLIDGRADLVQIAARLHTRTDVAWTDLASAAPVAEPATAASQ